jgi:hypothetical protein
MNTGSIMPTTITRASAWESDVIAGGSVRASTAGLCGVPGGRFEACGVVVQRPVFHQSWHRAAPMPCAHAATQHGKIARQELIGRQ